MAASQNRRRISTEPNLLTERRPVMACGDRQVFLGTRAKLCLSGHGPAYAIKRTSVFRFPDPKPANLETTLIFAFPQFAHDPRKRSHSALARPPRI